MNKPPPQSQRRPYLRLVHPVPPQPEMPQYWSGAPPMKNPPAWAQQLADNLNRNVLAGVLTS